MTATAPRRIATATRSLVLAGVVVAFACNDDERAPGAADAGSEADAAVPPADARPRKDASGPIIDVDCPVDATVEFEPNDTPDIATTMDGLSFCGAITPGTDEDHSTFTTPPGRSSPCSRR